MQHCFPFCFFRFLSVIKLFSVLTDDAAARANPPPRPQKTQSDHPKRSVLSLRSAVYYLISLALGHTATLNGPRPHGQ